MPDEKNEIHPSKFDPSVPFERVPVPFPTKGCLAILFGWLFSIVVGWFFLRSIDNCGNSMVTIGISAFIFGTVIMFFIGVVAFYVKIHGAKKTTLLFFQAFLIILLFVLPAILLFALLISPYGGIAVIAFFVFGLMISAMIKSGIFKG